MKKVISLMVVALIVAAILLVGCATETTKGASEETVEVVDEEGNLVGEASRFAPMKYKLITTKIVDTTKVVDKSSLFKKTKDILEENKKYCLLGYIYLDPYQMGNYDPTSKIDADAHYLCLQTYDQASNPFNSDSACGTMGYLLPDFGMVDTNVNDQPGKAYVCFFEP